MPNFDDFLRRQEEIIDTVGWAVMHVLPTADDSAATSPFAYTVGLTAHGYPELTIAGLDHAVAHALLNDLAQRVFDRAERFTSGQRVSDLLAGYTRLTPVSPNTYDRRTPGDHAHRRDRRPATMPRPRNPSTQVDQSGLAEPAATAGESSRLVAFDRDSECRPTDTETAMLASLVKYNYRPYRDSFVAELAQKPLDVDGGASGRFVFHKFGPDDWGYRRHSFVNGWLWSVVSPSLREREAASPNRGPFTLAEILDRALGHGGGPPQGWLDWKAGHPEIFG